MRNPREDLLPASEHLRILPLDVTDVDSIARAVELAGPVDVLVNNAGGGSGRTTPFSNTAGIVSL